MSYDFKKKYIEELRVELRKRKIRNDEIKDILDDYSQLYDDAIEKGLSVEETYSKLGSPKEIAKELGGSFIDDINPYRNKKKRSNLMVSLAPLLSTVVFLLLGFIWDLWHPGWLVFFWVPMASVIFGSRKRFTSILSALSPFIAVSAYIILGYFGFWHPGWIVFLIIPILGIFNQTYYSDKKTS